MISYIKKQIIQDFCLEPYVIIPFNISDHIWNAVLIKKKKLARKNSIYTWDLTIITEHQCCYLQCFYYF